MIVDNLKMQDDGGANGGFLLTALIVGAGVLADCALVLIENLMV